ncbi:MAG: hypothetical protein ABIV63_20265 [Caldimonas sp.]
MKLFPDTAWFSALKTWRRHRRAEPDAGDMGTAFGLDSITIIDFEPTSAPGESPSSTLDHWQRRVARRSRL